MDPKNLKMRKKTGFFKNPVFFYERISLSDVLTNTNAAVIGIITIRTAKIILLRNAPREGVIVYFVYYHC